MNNLMLLLDLFGTVVFAITGCLVAARRQTDVIGFILLAVVTGIGGGTMRDVILGNTPVFWVAKPIYLTLCTATALFMYFAARYINIYKKPILWADAVGLGVFTIIGTEVAMLHDASTGIAVLMGVMTATFGGIIRDVLSHQKTLILKKEIYASAAFTGSLVYILIYQWTGGMQEISIIASFLTTFGIRALGIIYDLRLPGYKWIAD